MRDASRWADAVNGDGKQDIMVTWRQVNLRTGLHSALGWLTKRFEAWDRERENGQEVSAAVRAASGGV
jgi:hypothetical protein